MQASGIGPLQGLGVAVKDIFDTADLPTRYGSALYSTDSNVDQTPRADAAIIGATRRAGGLVIGKTSTTEFAFLNSTKTLSPNASGRTPGRLVNRLCGGSSCALGAVCSGYANRWLSHPACIVLQRDWF